MPGFKDGDLTIYPYGDNDAPAGAGRGAQEFKKILESLAPGEKFVDPLFPATSKSFGKLTFTYEEGDAMNVKWLRPTEIAKELFKAPPIFCGPFDEFCVNQGMVGDCWFLAVLADVATVPECIETLIPKDNSEVGFEKGVFHFRFWCRGKWVDVVVDDQLPCVIDDDGELSTAFTKPTKIGGFWAALMEKAYAKLYGNYGCIDAGYPTDAMKDFTGGFVRCYERERDKDTDWKEIILEGKLTNAIMSVGTVSECPEGLLAPQDPDNPGPEGVSREGIVLGHEYSLLDIQEVRDISDSSKTYTLLKLRNPWGNDTEWNGAFSDSDPIWNSVTPNLRANPDQVRPDGEFWIPLENWLIYLDDFDICHWSKGYRGDSGSLVTEEGFVVFQTSANFPSANNGEVKDPEDFEGKPGYYLHLRPQDSNAGKTGNTGLKNNCRLVVNLMYQNYVTSGDNPEIPAMGFHLLWAPGEQKPDEKEYFKKVKVNEKHMNPAGGARDINVSLHLPAGTAFIIPWLGKALDEPAPYLLRIAGEGELHAYSP